MDGSVDKSVGQLAHLALPDSGSDYPDAIAVLVDEYLDDPRDVEIHQQFHALFLG